MSDADNQINPDGNGRHRPKKQVYAREYDPHIVSNRYCSALKRFDVIYYVEQPNNERQEKDVRHVDAFKP